MKISYLVNYLDPQMSPFCDALYELTDHSFQLLQTEAFPDRLIQNHHEDLSTRPYIHDISSSGDRKAKAARMIQDSDILLSGHSEEQFFDLCVSSGIPTFRLSQLIYRHFDIYHIPLKWKVSYYLKHTLRLKNKPVYMLCMGTYTSQDYSLTHSYDGKRYNFAELPPVQSFEIDELLKEKSLKPITILWSGKMEAYRDPMITISLSQRLIKDHIPFHMELVGDGSLFEQIREKIADYKLDSAITLIQDSSEETIREHMKHSSIYLLTGNLDEGWGEEVNHAMNLGNAVVVSHLSGASAMIDHGKNGVLFEQGNLENLEKNVRVLIENRDLCRSLGRNAYHFVTEKYTGKIAAERFLRLAESILKNEPSPYAEGLCAPASVITYEDMKKITRKELIHEQ